MPDQIGTLTKYPPIFQLGLPPGNGSTACTDAAVAMIIRAETGKTVTADQVRRASGNTNIASGLNPRQVLNALVAFGVTGYAYHPYVTADDVLKATAAGLVLVGVGYRAYPTMQQAELGGKTDLGFGGPHAILIAGARYWATKPAPAAWGDAQIPFVPGWRCWGRDPDHTQGWSHRYERFSTGYLVRGMAALIGSGSPAWQNTFMVAKGPGGLRATLDDPPGFDTPIDQPESETPQAPGIVGLASDPTSPFGQLGLRPPVNKPSLKLASFLSGTLPTYPLIEDYLAKVPTWILGANDKFGDCGPVLVANNRLQITTYLTDAPQNISQGAIFDLYRRSGNPDFDPATGAGDRGVSMQTMLEALHADGIEGARPVAFAQVNVANGDEVRAAIAIFGNLLFGITLDVNQKAQTPSRTWDYSPSAVWGGHAVLAGAYRHPGGAADRISVVSWAEIVECTDPFLQNQLGEAWVVIWPEHLGTKQFEQGVDLAAMRDAYKQLTGSDLPVTPGVPASVPAPAPVPSTKRTGCSLSGVIAALVVGALVAGMALLR